MRARNLLEQIFNYLISVNIARDRLALRDQN